jgi:UDP-glucose 4-epimerase
MKKAIVFGANGYLGRHIAYFLNENKIDFIPTDLADKSIDNYPNYKSIDVTNKEDLLQINYDVDYVFLFAGLTGTSNTPEMIEKYTKVNEEGLINVLNCCKGKENLRIIFPSTRLVYKGVEGTPLKETSEKEHKTIYAKNKLACEDILEKNNVDYTIFRICVPYGNMIDEEYSYGTLGFFINKAKKDENITIYGDGSLRRTFTHITDICKIILNSLDLTVTKNEIFNIGSNDSLSLLKVAQLVALKYGVSVDHVEWPEEALKIESGDTIFNDKKLQDILDYQYQHSIKEWIKSIK